MAHQCYSLMETEYRNDNGYGTLHAQQYTYYTSRAVLDQFSVPSVQRTT